MSLTLTPQNPSSESRTGTGCTVTGSVMADTCAESVCTVSATRRGWQHVENCSPTSSI